MNRSDLLELYYITPISNIPSILVNGILCHRRAGKITHDSIAMSEIQDRREKKRVPGGRFLHDYVNLYFCARNPMLYKRKDMHREICVLSVDCRVLDLPQVVIADGNASSDWTRFWPSPDGIGKIEQDKVFAEFWTDPNEISKWQKTRVKCAEVLVPDRVAPQYLLGAYVSCDEARLELARQSPGMTVNVDAFMFFR